MCPALTAQKPVKLAVVGAGAVGKSTLIARLATGSFVDKKMTTGFDIESWTLSADGCCQLKVSLFDFGGQPQFRFFQSDLVTGARGALLVFDCSSFPTLLQINEWLDMVACIPRSCKLLVGNKAEKTERIPDDVISETCAAYGLDFILVSAMTGENFDSLEEWLRSLCMTLSKNVNM